jgi:hypothetical protein
VRDFGAGTFMVQFNGPAVGVRSLSNTKIRLNESLALYGSRPRRNTSLIFYIISVLIALKKVSN